MSLLLSSAAGALKIPSKNEEHLLAQVDRTPDGGLDLVRHDGADKVDDFAGDLDTVVDDNLKRRSGSPPPLPVEAPDRITRTTAIP
jgi:hypothetical protein